jgi:hypothetical protein
MRKPGDHKGLPSRNVGSGCTNPALLLGGIKSTP